MIQVWSIIHVVQNYKVTLIIKSYMTNHINHINHSITKITKIPAIMVEASSLVRRLKLGTILVATSRIRGSTCLVRSRGSTCHLLPQCFDSILQRTATFCRSAVASSMEIETLNTKILCLRLRSSHILNLLYR